MIYLDLVIFFIIGIIIYIKRKELLNLLRIVSIITIILGYLLILLSNIIKLILFDKIKIINISNISSIIIDKLINRGLILILIGGLEIIIYVIIRYIKYGYLYNEKRRTIKQ